MPILGFAVLAALFALTSYYAGMRKARFLAVMPSSVPWHSSPGYHGLLTALYSVSPILLILVAFLSIDSGKHIKIAILLAAIVAFIGMVMGLRKVKPELPARPIFEKILEKAIGACSLLSILITLAILLTVTLETLRFFESESIIGFLFGTHWSPQTALRADQAGSSGSFGALPLFAGTLLITLTAMIVAIPIGLLSAIYLSEYAGRRFRAYAKPMLEILAGVPTVVYGYFAALTVAPFFRDVGAALSIPIDPQSALAAGLVMGVMIIPFVSSLSDDIINAVPQALRDASYGLGSTQSEAILKVILPAALPGIMGAILLAFSRAIGETMIVVMAAGLSANMTLNPMESVTTVTVQIVSLLVGDQEFDSPKTLAAFALGFTLFIVTLLLNLIAQAIVNRYKERYD